MVYITNKKGFKTTMNGLKTWYEDPVIIREYLFEQKFLPLITERRIPKYIQKQIIKKIVENKKFRIQKKILFLNLCLEYWDLTDEYKTFIIAFTFCGNLETVQPTSP